MLFRTITLCSLVAVVAAPSYAEVTLDIPDSVNVYVVNQEKPDFDSNLLGGDKSVSLPNGVNQILFQYIPEFVGRDDVAKVYSQYIIAKFDAADTTVTFELPRYKNERQANAEIDQLKWGLKSSNGQSVAVTEDTITIRGMTLGRDYVRDVTKYNQTAGVASLHMSTKLNNQPSSMTVTPVSLNELQQQYLKLSEQERKAFLQWAVSQ